MIVVGGLYRECCLVPEWDQIFGSGGRGAAALAKVVPGIKLYAPCAPDFQERAGIAMHGSGVELVPISSAALITFSYFHPLSIPEWNPVPKRNLPIDISADVVLRYGMIESEAIAHSDTAIYDPQSDAGRYRANGSSARRLATVLNENDARIICGTTDPIAAALSILDDGPDDVVILKRGIQGAEIFSRPEGHQSIPAYYSDSVFKIGSGDVFSAAFAFHWAQEGRRASEAADLASRATAHYVGCRTLPLPTSDAYSHGGAVRQGPLGRIYIAGPFFSMSQRWLIEEAVRALESMGCEVFSPLREVGGGNADIVAPADLAGLDASKSILAILDGGDPGTLFEVGYAKGRSIPVVALAEDVHQRDLTMPVGSGAAMVHDFTTAIYRVAWASIE